MRSTSAIRGRSVRGLLIQGLPAVAAALALAGCSSAAPAPEVAGSDRGGPVTPQDDNAVRRAWVDCMHKQGQTGVEQDKDGNIGFPAASTDTGMPSGYDAASRLCDEKVPGIHQVQKADNAKFVEMGRKWVECARKNGYSDMPDPDPEDGVVIIPRAVFDAAKWDAVVRACEAKFPLPGYRIGE
ncbi:hypothetical protein [Streptomyces sp. NBC_01264]|uniref:hypothetical protein n=1 Tax=Streptomyces sp. NBC_01264 TaxID=2903804 RepID=UPI00224DFD17|nr:hypothetical protein [Streptomyces sp. NBC_01264]MCX4783149.1 hypothetical protein [Streptomyces sp. NBC_01264]